MSRIDAGWERLRGLVGSAVVVPVVVLLWGSSWQLGGLTIDQRLLLIPLWGGLALGLVLARVDGTARASQAMLAAWGRADPVLAALLLQAVLFRMPQTVVVPALIFVALVGLLLGLRRASAPVALGSAMLFVLLFVALPAAFEAAVLSRVSATYALDVDHRLWPDGKEINAHGARFRGESDQLDDADQIVLFLGDSFTFGFNLAYEDSYPYRVEALAAAAGCEPTVRVVNMGWTSSSPLLALRLLRQVGYHYRPDLIVYSLDTTDFHDDLRYEWRLREQHDFDFDTAVIAERFVARELPFAKSLAPGVSAITTRLRSVDRERRTELLAGLTVPRPDERFFVTARPLEETRPAIELGVMKNLAEMYALTREVLDADMALVLYPRAYQYSDREVPRNWETGYTPLGPHVREPFRYFEEVAEALPYPVIDLYEAYATSERFPLFFANDPHWTEQGADVAARATAPAARSSGRPRPGGRALGAGLAHPLARDRGDPRLPHPVLARPLARFAASRAHDRAGPLPRRLRRGAAAPLRPAPGLAP